MVNYPIPENESARLRALYDYEILDTISEDEYDSLQKLPGRIAMSRLL